MKVKSQKRQKALGFKPKSNAFIGMKDHGTGKANKGPIGDIDQAKQDLINRKLGKDAIAKKPQTHYLGNNDSANSQQPEENSVDPNAAGTEEPADVGDLFNGTGGDRVTITRDELFKIVEQNVIRRAATMNQDTNAQLERVSRELQTVTQSHKSDVQKLQQEIETQAAEAKRLRSVLDFSGTSIPTGARPGGGMSLNINTMLLPSSQEPQGAARDFFEIYNNAAYTPQRRVFDSQTGDEYLQVDTTQIDNFLRNPKNRSAFLADAERLFKGNGFLLGSGQDAQAGYTLGGESGSIRDTFLPIISALLRTSHNPRYVWHQFVSARLAIGREPGTTVMVPRFTWLDEPESLEDFILDDEGFTTDISGESQAVKALTTPIKIRGLGLGRGNKVGNRPVGIPEFHLATSLVDLMMAVETRLGQNYNATEDMAIHDVYRQALNNPDLIFYNDNGNLTQNPGDVGAGDDGTMTEEYLNAAFSEMTRRGIPTFDNGTRSIVLNTYSTPQIKNSLGDKLQAPTESAIQEVTNILNAGGLGNGLDKPTGYLGTYCNFMLFESGTVGTGVPNTPRAKGVYQVNLGVGSAVVHDNYAFGPGVCGQGIALPVEVRMDDSGKFGTGTRFIWRSIEGWDSLDCTSTNPGQQDRVLVLRNTQRPV